MTVKTNTISITELNQAEMEAVSAGGLLDSLKEKAMKITCWVYRNEKDIKAHTIGVVASFFSNAHVGKYLKDEYKKNH